MRTSDAGSSPARRMSPSVLQHTEVGDEERADAERDAASHLGDCTPRSRACPRATPPAADVDERLSAGVPRAARAEEERDLDTGIGSERAPSRGSRRRSASSRRFPARPAARARIAARPPPAPPRARAGPRPRGSRCGSGGRPRSVLAHARGPYAQNASKASGSLGSASTCLHEPVLEAEEQHLLELERPPVAPAARAVERRRAIVAREDVDQLGAVRSARLPRELREEAEDRLASRRTCRP